MTDDPEVIEVHDTTVTVDVHLDPVTVIEIVTEGPQGPPGSGSSAIVYVQEASSSTWVIPHTLGRPPNVLLLNTAGKRIYGDEYPADTSVTVLYSIPVAGKAVLT